MDPQIATTFNLLLALVLSLSCHEWGHAFVAKLQGDPTAEQEGRLTLNPVAHIDIIGTIILPLVMFITAGGFIGWAKPVPVNLRNLKNVRWGHMLIAAAGPAVNLALCFIFIFAHTIYVALNGRPDSDGLFMAFVGPMIHLNAILAIFNLIPLAPLDGGTVFPAFLPQSLRTIYEEYVAPNGMFILIALLVFGSLTWITRIANVYIALVSMLAQAIIL